MLHTYNLQRRNPMSMHPHETCTNALAYQYPIAYRCYSECSWGSCVRGRDRVPTRMTTCVSMDATQLYVFCAFGPVGSVAALPCGGGCLKLRRPRDFCQPGFPSGGRGHAHTDDGCVTTPHPAVGVGSKQNVRTSFHCIGRS